MPHNENTWDGCFVNHGLDGNWQRLLIAILVGSVTSLALFLWSFQAHSHAPLWPQVMGFYACVMMRGLHTATKADYLAIMVPINALVYAAVIFIPLHLFARRSSPH
jgi:hypothetical protein